MPEREKCYPQEERIAVSEDFKCEYQKALLLALQEKGVLEEELLQRCLWKLENKNCG